MRLDLFAKLKCQINTIHYHLVFKMRGIICDVKITVSERPANQRNNIDAPNFIGPLFDEQKTCKNFIHSIFNRFDIQLRFYYTYLFHPYRRFKHSS